MQKLFYFEAQMPHATSVTTGFPPFPNQQAIPAQQIISTK